MKLTVGQSIIGCFAVILALSLIASYSAVSTVRAVQEVADQSLTRSARALDIVGALNTSLANVRFCQRGVILYSIAKDDSEAETQRKKLGQEIASVRTAMAQLRPLLDSAKKLEALGGFEQAFGSYQDLAGEIVRDARSGHSDEAMAILKIKSRPFGAAMEKAAADMANGEREWMRSAATVVQSTCNHGNWIQFGSMLALVGCGVGVLLMIRTIIRTLRQAASEMSSVAEQVRSAAAQVSAGSQSLAQGASQQAASLEETSASSQEISTITQKNADTTQSATQLASQVGQQMGHARESLALMVSSMQQIGDSSTKISKIIRVIDDIAFQTNILALNAAVEAARAGEAGAGFAVVADEVRNLAQRCADAARQTTALIEESVVSSGEGRQNVDHVSSGVESLAAGVATMKTLVEDVNAGCQQQTQGVAHITRAMGEMNTVMQAVAANAEQSAAASQEMSSQAEVMARVSRDLRQMVDSRASRSAE
jgi:methyl-accepting chemotaxis protein/methyl-accepting chemotaxis protein-1 (serine sensor receptor)